MNHTWRETTREKGGHSLPSTLRASGESAGNMERSAGTIEVSAQVAEATTLEAKVADGVADGVAVPLSL